MGKTFRSWDPEQRLLLPPAVDEFVPAGHLAPFVRDLVREELDLAAIVDTYTEERGYPPYDPVMMTALLLYAYAQGLYASRRIARACEERVDFLAVTAMNRPDFRTISDFRKRHLPALQGLFVQVLRLCARAGLVRLGHVALDGTKVKANASKHKAMSYGRMKQAEARLAAEVAGWLAQAEAADAADDAALGAAQRGDELPDWVAHKQQRLAKIQAAKAALEAEAAAADRRDDDGAASPPPAATAPPDKAQRNFTDPESRIMKGPDGFVQAYNAQLGVDARMTGPPWRMSFLFGRRDKVVLQMERTLFQQELIRHGVFMPWICPSFRHGPDEIEQTVSAFSQAAQFYARAIEARSVDGLLEGPAVKPVFRRFN